MSYTIGDGMVAFALAGGIIGSQRKPLPKRSDAGIREESARIEGSKPDDPGSISDNCALTPVWRL
jgi:hypothetical protein